MTRINARGKGDRLEYAAVNWMNEKAPNSAFKRVGMSGQLGGLKGDFRWLILTDNGPLSPIGKEFTGEAKSGSEVPKKLYKWLEKDGAKFLVLKRDGKPRLWVLTEEILERLLK